MVITVRGERMKISTNDKCVLCQKQWAPSTRKCEGKRKPVSVKLLTRYLQVQAWKLTDLPASSPSNQSRGNAENCQDIYISVCLNCDELLERFSTFYKEVEVARMKLEGVSNELLKAMTAGGDGDRKRNEGRRSKTRRSKRTSPVDVSTLGLAQRFREETLRKCRDKVARSMPRVVLRKDELRHDRKLELDGEVGLPLSPPKVHNLANIRCRLSSVSEAANDTHTLHTLHTDNGAPVRVGPSQPEVKVNSPSTSDAKTATSISRGLSSAKPELELCSQEAPIILTGLELPMQRDKEYENVENNVPTTDIAFGEDFNCTVIMVTEEELLEFGGQQQVVMVNDVEGVEYYIAQQSDNLDDEATDHVGGLCSFCGREYSATMCEHCCGESEIEENIVTAPENHVEINLSNEGVDEEADCKLSSSSVSITERSHQVLENVVTDNDKENHTCDTCGYKFASARGLSKHERTHARPPYEGAEPSPKKCKKSRPNEGRYLTVSPSNEEAPTHSKKQGDDGIAFGCSFCDKTFFTLQNYHNHQFVLHPIEFLDEELPPGTTKNELDKVLKGFISTSERCGETNKYCCPHCRCMRAQANDIKLHILKMHLSRVIARLKETRGRQEVNAEAQVRKRNASVAWELEDKYLDDCERRSKRKSLTATTLMNPYTIYDQSESDDES